MVQKIVRQGIFRGFSSIDNNKRVLNDIEIVKQDLKPRDTVLAPDIAAYPEASLSYAFSKAVALSIL